MTLADEIETMVHAFGSRDSRSVRIREIAAKVRLLEALADEARDIVKWGTLCDDYDAEDVERLRATVRAVFPEDAQEI